MPHAYLEALTTESVQAAQRCYGSRDSMARLVDGLDADGQLGPNEAEFIAECDGFYLATVGETGWPYVQYRGGPPGFLRMLDVSTLGWADFRGNRQYLSMGNLAASARVSLFLMDYAARRRLKILGTARVLDLRNGPEAAALGRQLTIAGYDARVERAVTVQVHGYDWDCPQHITPRWTAADLAPVLTPLQDEVAQLRSENTELREQLGALATGDRPTAQPPSGSRRVATT